MENTSDILVSRFGKLKTLDQLALISGYEKAVPTIGEFIENPYYMGSVLGNGKLFPIWRTEVEKLFPTPYSNHKSDTVVLTSAIGTGKTSAALLITFYNLCRLLSLKDPHEFYGLLSSTSICVAMASATQNLAGSVLMNQVIEWVEASPFFKENLALKLKGKSSTLFKNNIDIISGSRGSMFVGRAVIGCIMSEANQNVVGNQSVDLYDEIYTRRLSRFGGKGKHKEILGSLIIDSSSIGTKSFIDTYLEEKEKGGAANYSVIKFSHWEAKMHIPDAYPSKLWFDVFCGDESSDPFIIDDKTSKQLLERVDKSRIVSVPEEHRIDFNTNIVKGIRDLIGMSTFGSMNFMNSVEMISSAMCRFNPVTKDVIILDFFDKSQRLSQYLDIHKCTFTNKSNRFIHVDLGLKWDSTGIACTYLDGYIDIMAYDSKGDITNTVERREPKFVTEWVMEIKPTPGLEVPIYKIKEFFTEARTNGYPISKISTDGYQSTNLRQDLTLDGFDCELISVDRTPNPYYYLRDCILEGRLSAPSSEKLVEELRELEEHTRDSGNTKIDHNENGSKDLCDAVTGSLWACSQNIHEAGTMLTASDMSNNISQLLDSISTPAEKLEQVLHNRN